MKVSKKTINLDANLDANLDTELYRLDFSYRLEPTQINLEKIGGHLKLYPKLALQKLKAKNFPNLCIGTKNLAKEQEMRIITQELKDMAQKDSFEL